MVWQVRRGIIAGRGALDAAPAGPSPAYSYLGSFSSTSLPSGSTATMPFTMTNTAGLLVVFFGVQNSKSITSVVYDPTGANVTLTQDAFNNTGNTGGMWSGAIPAASGSKNVVVTASTTVSFLAAGGHAWLATDLISSSAQTAANSSGASASISVTAGYFMFGGAFVTGAPASVNWSTSTQVPAAVNANAAPNAWGADWTIASTNASFSAIPKAATAFNHAYATYH